MALVASIHNLSASFHFANKMMFRFACSGLTFSFSFFNRLVHILTTQDVNKSLLLTLKSPAKTRGIPISLADDIQAEPTPV